MCVRWKYSLSNHFSIGNGVLQGTVLPPPLLFPLYYRYVVIRLHNLELCFHIGQYFLDPLDMPKSNVDRSTSWMNYITKCIYNNFTCKQCP